MPRWIFKYSSLNTPINRFYLLVDSTTLQVILFEYDRSRGGTAEVPFHIEQAEKAFTASVDRVFGIDPSSQQPHIDLGNETEMREAMGKMFENGLILLKLEQEDVKDATDLSVKEAIQGDVLSSTDFDFALTQYERARDVVSGKRANPDSLIKAIGPLADSEQRKAVEDYNNKVALIPRSGFLGIFGQKETPLEDKRLRTQVDHIGNVLDYVNTNAPKWAEEAKASRSQPVNAQTS